MEARLRQALARAEEVAHELADPETARNPAKLKQLGREHARLDGIRQTHQRLERLRAELAQAREVLEEKDPELAQLARADVERLRPEIERLERGLAEQLGPTESQGRIHTSAATVAVLPEAEEVEVKIEDKDLRIDVFRSSGPGGQSVNTTDSAVRVTHLPTGIVVQCQDQKSQLQNKIKALEILRSRLLDRMLAEQEAARARDRRAMVGTGDRSAKIRTYNFPQNRVTDHRIHHTVHDLEAVLDGKLDELINALKLAGEKERLSA